MARSGLTLKSRRRGVGGADMTPQQACEKCGGTWKAFPDGDGGECYSPPDPAGAAGFGACINWLIDSSQLPGWSPAAPLPVSAPAGQPSRGRARRRPAFRARRAGVGGGIGGMTPAEACAKCGGKWHIDWSGGEIAGWGCDYGDDIPGQSACMDWLEDTSQVDPIPAGGARRPSRVAAPSGKPSARGLAPTTARTRAGVTPRGKPASKRGLTFRSQVRRPGIGFHPALLAAAAHGAAHGAAVAAPIHRKKGSARALGMGGPVAPSSRLTHGGRGSSGQDGHWYSCGTNPDGSTMWCWMPRPHGGFPPIASPQPLPKSRPGPRPLSARKKKSRGRPGVSRMGVGDASCGPGIG